MVKKIISLIIMITITMMMTSHVFAQDTVFIDDNFEASSTENWIDNTGRGIKSVEGDIWNKYMVLTHKDSSFYNFQARDIYSTGVLYCEFDIKFTSVCFPTQYANGVPSKININDRVLIIYEELEETVE